MRGTNLSGAKLSGGDLRGADLHSACLDGTDLCEANLQDAKLIKTEHSKGTILPDGTVWTPDTDVAHFTDPEHPDFWRSDNPYSPAYRGDEG